jgi:cell division septation protein DedD
MIAGVFLIVAGIAGALYYLGLIPGPGVKKTVSVQPVRTEAGPKAETPAPAPSSAQPPVSQNEQSQAASENKAAPAASSPASPMPAAKGPSQQSVAAAAKAKPSGKTVYSVQIGVFKIEANAAALTKQFKEKGYDAFMTGSTVKDKGTLYRVLIGKSEDRKESERLAAGVREKEKIKAVVYSE